MQFLMSCMIPNMLYNRDLQQTQYLALTFSNWHSKYDGQVRHDSWEVKSAAMQPYFKIMTIPYTKDPKTNMWRYQFIGQGWRAICYRRQFAEHVIAERIDHWIDIHILNLLTQLRNKNWSNKRDTPNLACFCDPSLFEHDVDNHNSELFKTLAFIQVFDRASDSKWKCARQNINQCRGLFDNQCQVDLGTKQVKCSPIFLSTKSHVGICAQPAPITLSTLDASVSAVRPLASAATMPEPDSARYRTISE